MATEVKIALLKEPARPTSTVDVGMSAQEKAV
jgi:hypothetical protein